MPAPSTLPRPDRSLVPPAAAAGPGLTAVEPDGRQPAQAEPQPLPRAPPPTSITQAALIGMIKAHEIFVARQAGGARMILRVLNLTGLNFHGRNLSDADFTGSDMTGCNLSGVRADGAHFFGTVLVGAQMAGASLVRADMRGAVLSGADLSNANLEGADLRPGKVATHSKDGFTIGNQAQRRVTVADNVNLRGANLNRANLDEASAHAADFSDCTMRGARLVGANMKSANLSGAMLEGADLAKANLRDADLSSAVVTGASFEGATMAGAEMRGVVRDPTAEALARRGELREALAGHQVWCLTNGKQGSAAVLDGADLRIVGDILKSAQLTGLQARGACFIGLDLQGANLQVANLEGADFRMANLGAADMRGGRLARANLVNSNLRGACLADFKVGDRVAARTDLTGALLRYADCRDIDISADQLADADTHQATFSTPRPPPDAWPAPDDAPPSEG